MSLSLLLLLLACTYLETWSFSSHIKTRLPRKLSIRDANNFRLSIATAGDEIPAIIPLEPIVATSDYSAIVSELGSTRQESVSSDSSSNGVGRSTKTLKKLLPLGLMLFLILFNYTILRDTKDVLVVTAPGSGAEIIPFLKTYVNLPVAIAFTISCTQYISNLWSKFSALARAERVSGFSAAIAATDGDT